MKHIVVATGGFDPLHSGHIAYFQEARELGDMLIIGVNSDDWLRRKKGQEFMPWRERACIIANLYSVDRVISFDDSDNSAKDAIREVRKIYPTAQIIFANGGDRTQENIPEMDLLEEMSDLEFKFGVGGKDKQNSSSWILQEWKAPKTDRVWGNYRVIHETGQTLKVKELNVAPGKSLSMQKHQSRSEFWFVAQGYASVYTLENDREIHMGTFGEHQGLWLPANKWHRLANYTSDPLKIVEIQYGNECSEVDIVRR